MRAFRHCQWYTVHNHSHDLPLSLVRIPCLCMRFFACVESLTWYNHHRREIASRLSPHHHHFRIVSLQFFLPLFRNFFLNFLEFSVVLFSSLWTKQRSSLLRVEIVWSRWFRQIVCLHFFWLYVDNGNVITSCFSWCVCVSRQCAPIAKIFGVSSSCLFYNTKIFLENCYKFL